MTTPTQPSPTGGTAGSRVLVVCTGNICRSPIAAALLKRSAAFGADASVTSAGLRAVVDHPVDSVMLKAVAGVAGLDLEDFRARQLTSAMIDDADLILTMTTRQRSEVLGMTPGAIDRTFTMRQFADLVQHHGASLVRGELSAERGGQARDLPLDIVDPHRRGLVAMRIAALEVAHAVEALALHSDPAATSALTGRSTIRVMSSSPKPTESTSPYLIQLGQSLDADSDITYRNFTWRQAMFGRSDVFHSHWPEAMLAGSNALKSWVRRLMFVVMLLNFRLRRTAVVQTMHNLAPHESQGSINRWLLGRFDRRVRMRIAINATTPWSPGAPVQTILHGDYRDWFSRFDLGESDPDALVFFGLIRRYKGVDHLVRTFRGVTSSLRLLIAGRPDPATLATDLEELASGDDRIELDLRFVPEADLVAAITRSTLAVLPYRELHNSGAALTALSLDRPVLVPRNDSTDALAREVGEGWILRFDGEITVPQLEQAMTSARNVIATGQRPDLSRRVWASAGAVHAAVFREAALRASLRRSRDRG